MSAASKLTMVRSLATAVRVASRPGGPSLAQRAQAMPRLVRAVVSGQYTGTSIGRLALLAAATGYIVSPVDFLPEGLLGPIGLADDAMVASWLAAQLVNETEDFLAWERAQGGSHATVPGEVVRPEDGSGS